MGRGDKKTKKGKIAMGSHGVLRPKKDTSGSSSDVAKKKVVKSKAAATEKDVEKKPKKAKKES
jgi:30S ribosomal protein S31